MSIIFSRAWAMPDSRTYNIKPINRLIHKYVRPDILSIDPFANDSKIAKITNDIDPQYICNYNIDALDFLKMFDSNSVDAVLFDPPYSVRQVAECYKKMGKTVNFETTQATFWTKLKNEISRIVRHDGYVLSFGWNSNGIGKTHGFEMIEILMVAHGGPHNDTIVTVERKVQGSLF
jgi:hypothetical protein